MLQLVDMSAQQAVRPDVLLLERVFRFKASVDTTATKDSVTYAYRKTFLNVERRNVLLLPVPTMYRIAHGPRREYIEETYERITQKGLEEIGDELGLTRERVRQIREKSIAKLRDSGNAKILMKYLG